MADPVPKSEKTPHWRHLTLAERSAAYSPSSVLDGPLDPYIAAYERESAASYLACPLVQTLSYGPKPTNSLDVVMPQVAEPAPLHVFIHGGYWQELSKRESFFAAADTLRDGIGFAALDYTLAPDASLDEIVQECVSALNFLHDSAAALNIDPRRIVVSGSSAGAHLAAMTALGLGSDRLPAGLILLSGIYDLEPLLGTYINEAVGMDLACARRNSPAYHPLSNFPRTLLAWGENETDEFKRQSRHMGDLINLAGGSASTLEVANRNHFDIVFDLKPERVLGAYVRRFANVGRASLL